MMTLDDMSILNLLLTTRRDAKLKRIKSAMKRIAICRITRTSGKWYAEKQKILRRTSLSRSFVVHLDGPVLQIQRKKNALWSDAAPERSLISPSQRRCVAAERVFFHGVEAVDYPCPNSSSPHKQLRVGRLWIRRQMRLSLCS